MSKRNDTGVYQLENGCWAFRYAIMVDGKRIERKRNVDENGSPYKTKTAAIKARQSMMERDRNNQGKTEKKSKVTITQVYQIYCENGRAGKAYATIKKQDSLWENHIKSKFGKRRIDNISAAEINDYLSELYYTENRSYSYTESFLKMFYLIFGQAYSRNYLSAEQYDKLCKNKDTKIHMPKMKIEDRKSVV